MSSEMPRMIIQTIPVNEVTLVAQQLGDIFEFMRAGRDGMEFLPTQFGGLYGQREMLRDKSVVTMTKFRPREY